MTKTELIIWAAGFLDGEGYVGITRTKYGKLNRTYYRNEIHVAQKHRRPLDVLQGLFGGSVRRVYVNSNRYYQWCVYGAKAALAIRTVQPYLVVKCKQAELCLEFQATVAPKGKGSMSRYIPLPEEVHELRAAYHAAVMELNKRHPRAERLSEGAPHEEGDATVRTHGNVNCENQTEMSGRLLRFA